MVRPVLLFSVSFTTKEVQRTYLDLSCDDALPIMYVEFPAICNCRVGSTLHRDRTSAKCLCRKLCMRHQASQSATIKKDSQRWGEWRWRWCWEGKSAGQVCRRTLKCILISDLDFGHIASFIPPSNHLHYTIRVLETPENAREAATGHIRDEGLTVEFDTGHR